MKTLNANISDISFIKRECDKKGNTQRNRCGRDFIYYALNYYFKDKYNSTTNNPVELEVSHSLGLRLPWWLMWSQLQFLYLPGFMKREHLEFTINGKQIRSFFSLLSAISWPQKSNVQDRIREIEKAVDGGYASGIDISLGMGGLLDHVMFVYGYDEVNLYVFDSHQVPHLEYQKMTSDDKFYFRLPKSIIAKRWTVFGRVWVVKMVN